MSRAVRFVACLTDEQYAALESAVDEQTMTLDLRTDRDATVRRKTLHRAWHAVRIGYGRAKEGFVD